MPRTQLKLIRSTHRAVVIEDRANASHRATHEPDPVARFRPLRVGIAFANGHRGYLENPRLISTVERKAPVAKGHRRFLG